MKRSLIGTSELEVGALGIGCWSFGGGSYWGLQSQVAVEQVVREALDMGLNYFDTAESYNDGESERSLGLALGRNRGEAVIGSKFTPNHGRPDLLRTALEQSLRRLRTDYIDLYMLHWPVNGPALEHFGTTDGSPDTEASDRSLLADMYSTLQNLVQEGKIRAYGVSNHGMQQLQTALTNGARPAADELIYNLLSRAVEKDILPFCRDQEIGVIAYMPLHQGLLTGKYKTVESVPAHVARTRHFHHSRSVQSRHQGEGAESLLFQTLDDLRKLAKQIGVSLDALSLSWVMHRPGIAVAIVGCRNLQQLKANAGALEYLPSADVLAELNTITGPLYRQLGDNPDYYEPPERSRIS